MQQNQIKCLLHKNVTCILVDLVDEMRSVDEVKKKRLNCKKMIDEKRASSERVLHQRVDVLHKQIKCLLHKNVTCHWVDLVDEMRSVGQDELLQVAVQAKLHNHIQLS